MFKRIMLIVGVGLLMSSSHAQETKIIAWPNCEMGDAIFRDLRIPFVGWAGHVGIYFCSKSAPIEGADFTIDGDGFITKIDIQESDMTHSMIQGNGYKEENPQWPPEIKEVGLVTLDFALHGLPPWGAYNDGKLTAYERRRIVGFAYQQAYRGCRYATGDPKKGEKPRDIKNPATEENGWKGSFRCDGLVEYCYEKIGRGFFNAQDELDCWWGSSLKEIHIPKFYPESLAKKMKMIEATAPQIVSTELWKGGKGIEEDEKITGMVTVKVKVKDGTNGSGIDRVKFYWDDWFESPYNIEHLIDEKDDDKNDDGVEQEYSCNWDTTTVETGESYWVYTKVYDRAGNIATGEIFRITTSYTIDDGFSIIIDHTPPQVARTIPANGQTKVYLGNRIRITFSEQMATETINADTILLNNGAVVG
ncbi:MAG: Ig-like domain-containing protein, partial [bacterium]